MRSRSPRSPLTTSSCGRRRLGRLDGVLLRAPNAGPEDPRRREDRRVRLEGRRVDRRGLGLLSDARPQAVRPPLARAAPEAGLPLLVSSTTRSRACARPRRPGPRSSRARPRSRSTGRSSTSTSSLARRRKAAEVWRPAKVVDVVLERARPGNTLDVEKADGTPRDGSVQVARGRDRPTGDARAASAAASRRSSRTRRRRSGCDTAA